MKALGNRINPCIRVLKIHGDPPGGAQHVRRARCVGSENATARRHGFQKDEPKGFEYAGKQQKIGSSQMGQRVSMGEGTKVIDTDVLERIKVVGDVFAVGGVWTISVTDSAD